jgi:selenocysteine-specific elongation factor
MKTIRTQEEFRDRSNFQHVIIGTAGHIDHGKTALVYALTGTDTDRLPEEKQRGITIDLGFATLELENPSGSKLHLSLIDVPGHHAFVRNMLAGAGGIDCVMLVIAADEGVKAQTEEHLAICSLLGIEHGLVVLTKVDAVSPDHLSETRTQVEHFIAHTFLNGVPIIAVSALRGDGMADLKSALAALAAAVPARSSARLPRLPLDRAFSIRGFGTVVTGTLQAGSLHVGDTLEQHPAGRSLRVRGLQVHGKSAEGAQAPCRVALNLPGIEVAQIARGDILTLPNTLTATSTVDVELTMLRGARALKHGARVRVHAFTSESLAKVLFFDRKESSDSFPVLARLRLARPLLLLPGDRIVLRQCSPAMTIGGARVLDTTASPGVRKQRRLSG